MRASTPDVDQDRRLLGAPPRLAARPPGRCRPIDEPVRARGLASQLDGAAIDRLDRVRAAELRQPEAIGAERVGEDRVGSRPPRRGDGSQDVARDGVRFQSAGSSARRSSPSAMSRVPMPHRGPADRDPSGSRNAGRRSRAADQPSRVGTHQWRSRLGAIGSLTCSSSGCDSGR